MIKITGQTPWPAPKRHVGQLYRRSGLFFRRGLTARRAYLLQWSCFYPESGRGGVMAKQRKKSKMTNPHDSLFQDFMGHPKVYREFFLEYLPSEVLDSMNLATVKPSPKHFVNERFKNLHTDCLFEAEFDGKPGYLYVLAEHQSTIDPMMSFRLLQYMVAIWESWLKERGRAAVKLPLIYPMVIYSGRQTYKKATGLRDLIEGPVDLVDQILFQPFALLDLSVVDDHRLVERLHVGLLFMALKHAFDEAMPYEEILVQIPRLEREEDYLYFFRRLLRYILEIREDVAPEELRQKVERTVSRDAGEEVMTAAELLKEEGRLEGRLEGRSEGRKEGVISVALNFLKAGFAEDLVAENTGLSLAEIRKLKAKLD